VSLIELLRKHSAMAGCFEAEEAMREAANLLEQADQLYRGEHNRCRAAEAQVEALTTDNDRWRGIANGYLAEVEALRAVIADAAGNARAALEVIRYPTEAMMDGFMSANAHRIEPHDERVYWEGDFGQFAASFGRCIDVALGALAEESVSVSQNPASDDAEKRVIQAEESLRRGGVSGRMNKEPAGPHHG
jgi:hypothetical protein